MKRGSTLGKNDIPNGELYELFTHLGLNGSQARVYLALLEQGKMRVKDISFNSGVARQDIYRVLSELFEIGIIEKFVDTPLQFKAVPVQISTEVLIEKRQKDIIEQKQEANRLIKKYQQSTSEKQHESSYFATIPPKVVFIDKVKVSLKAIQKSEYIMTTPRRMYNVLATLEKEYELP